jgi:hypothetical protein
MTRLILGTLLLASLAGCSRLGILDPAGDILLRSGTSFGMCVGYCMTELVVRDGSATFAQTSREPGRYPPKKQALRLSAAEYEALRSVASAADFRQLQSVYGCPDCADGGAEWVEFKDRVVTLEYRADLQPLGPLLREVRALRARFQPLSQNHAAPTHVEDGPVLPN